MAVARAVLKTVKEERLQENCKAMSDMFVERIQKVIERMPSVYKEIRGRGLFLGIEPSGKNYEDSVHISHVLHRNLFDRGLICGRGSAPGNLLRFQPPMSIEKHDVD